MAIEQLSFNWFLLYYFLLGLVLLIQGIIWAWNPGSFVTYLTNAAERDQRPRYLIKATRYFFLFSGISLVFAFFPFSVFELFFALWSLAVVYILSSFLIRWDALREAIKNYRNALHQPVRRIGMMTVGISIALFALCYRLALDGGAI